MKTANKPRRSPWPLAIALGLLLVVLVNVAFAYIAVHGADGVVPSYNSERR
ncbi:MAG: hypothetical protein ABJD11_07780 [Gemmatimonadota bacterium]